MAPAQNGGSVNYQVVAWDLDTTGRRLIDEICHIGAYYVAGNGSAETFSQYVMPYKNPNPGARRSFGIKVVSIGKYRMLKDVDTGKILKTKSEISALQDFIDWLKVAKAGKDGVLLACHEPTRTVLVPLLLEALYRYNLVILSFDFGAQLHESKVQSKILPGGISLNFKRNFSTRFLAEGICPLKF